MPEVATNHPVLAEALAACRRSLAAVAVFSMALNLLSLALPLYLLQLYDRVLPNRSPETLAALAVAVALALSAQAGLDAVRGLVLHRVAEWLERSVGGELLSVSIKRALRKRRTPSVQMLRDLATVRGFVAGRSLIPLLDLPFTLLFILAIFALHPTLGWVTAAGAVLLLLIAVLNEVGTRRLLRQAGEAAEDALDQAQAAVRNADVVEAMGMRASLVRLWEARSEGGLALQARASARGQVASSAARLVRNGMQAAVVSVAAWLAINDQLSGGALFAAMLLMRRAAAPLERSIGAWKSVVSARSAYARLGERLASVPPDEARLELPAPATGRLEAEGLTYRHSGTPVPVLRMVSFRLEPGEVLGVVGPSAAGKSTLARLLVGLLEPDAGHVRLDGVEVTRWRPEILGPCVGYLPQGVELFAGTVAENIARLAEPDPAAVVRAAKLANAHDMILRLPKGYDTQIGDGGGMLSGGQRQRVGLARALYGRPRLVVLDEPDANLDREGKEALEAAIAALKGTEATVVVITHRTEMLRHADKVMMLKRVGPATEGSSTDGAERQPRHPVANAEIALVPRPPRMPGRA